MCKRIDHQKIELNVVYLSFVEHKRRNFEEFAQCSFPYTLQKYSLALFDKHRQAVFFFAIICVHD